MLPTTDPVVTDHFTARAARYDRSSRWCTDPDLARRTREAVAAERHHHLLDVACGTGLVSRLFLGRVERVVGVDVTPAMFDQARTHLDELVQAPAEDLPFADDSFDRVVCRQGVQFMDAPVALREMVRVARPGGRIVLVHLVAHGEEDREEYFEILRLRNPARRNFWVRGELATALREAGCRQASETHLVSEEDVDLWADNGAIDDGSLEAIRRVYQNASEPFRRLHAVRSSDGRHFVDQMLFAITVGTV